MRTGKRFDKTAGVVFNAAPGAGTARPGVIFLLSTRVNILRV
jgi:hypothetical protein